MPTEPLVLQDGWVAQAKRCPSPNHDARPEGCVIDTLVIHSISLPPGEYGGDYVQQLFQNCLAADAHPYFAGICELKVSAHFYIRRNGELLQCVPTHQRAWHAGQSEFCGRVAVNDFSIGVELEGTDQDPFETAQYHQLTGLVLCLQAAYPDITDDRLVGHSDIAPGRKTDPGVGFDWERLRGLLNE